MTLIERIDCLERLHGQRDANAQRYAIELLAHWCVYRGATWHPSMRQDLLTTDREREWFDSAFAEATLIQEAQP